MPVAASFYISSSAVGCNNLSSKAEDQNTATVVEFRQGKFGKESLKTVSNQLLLVSAMGAIKNGATGNVDCISKLPSQRILEVLGTSRNQLAARSNQTHLLENVDTTNIRIRRVSGVPMTVAVAEFKGPDVHGVVRFAQESSGQQACSIETIIDGLSPGAHGWSVHEFGDLTRGPLSTGPAYNLLTLPFVSEQQEGGEGNLGSLLVDSYGHVQTTETNNKLIVADVIGRSVVLYGVSSGADGQVHTRIAAAVIARSARPSSLNPQLCNCDGSLLWQGNSC